MEFHRVGEHQVRCLIAEQEITDMGFSIEDILKNGRETQRFMNQILKMAEEHLNLEFKEGIKTVRADFMENHTLSLTFSTHSAENMMEQLKEIIGDALSAATAGITPEEIERLMEAAEEDGEETDSVPQPGNERKSLKEDKHIHRLGIVFPDFDSLLGTSRRIAGMGTEDVPQGSLYKYEGEYFLILEMEGREDRESIRIGLLAEEFCQEMFTEAAQCAYIEEHGVPILKKNALQQLSTL